MARTRRKRGRWPWVLLAVVVANCTVQSASWSRAMPGTGGEEWEPNWIQWAIPRPGDYPGSAFFVREVGP